MSPEETAAEERERREIELRIFCALLVAHPEGPRRVDGDRETRLVYFKKLWAHAAIAAAARP